VKELVNQALGMHPAQPMPAEIELPGVIADHRGRGQEAMRPNAAPQGALGGDRDRVVAARERGDAEPVEMRPPSQAIGEMGLGMAGEPGDHRRREMMLAQIIERRGIDRVILVAGPQQFEEVAPALRAGGAKPGEMRVAGRAVAPSIPLGLLGLMAGRPFSPLSRAISSRKAAFSAVSSAIFASASSNSCLRSAMLRI